MHFVHSLPTIDAVEVVRCGKCKHADAYRMARDTTYCQRYDRIVPLDGYCQEGKREEVVQTMRSKIMPNDVVLHKPSGEKWVVAGVNHELGTLIPRGYPFPTVAKVCDCEIIQWRYEAHYQEKETIEALIKEGLQSYVDVRSAMLLDML